MCSGQRLNVKTGKKIHCRDTLFLIAVHVFPRLDRITLKSEKMYYIKNRMSAKLCNSKCVGKISVYGMHPPIKTVMVAGLTSEAPIIQWTLLTISTSGPQLVYQRPWYVVSFHCYQSEIMTYAAKSDSSKDHESQNSIPDT